MNIVAGFNVATVLVMLFVGYSDRFDPVAHPLLSNIGLVFPVFILLDVAFLVFWLFVSKRRALIALAGLVVCYQPVRTYVPLNPSRDVPEGALKVLSYNVYCFSKWDDLSESCPITDYLLRQDADIVCLQEANASGRKRELIDSLMSTRYTYSERTISKNKKIGDEIDLFSKYPIVDSEQLSDSSDTYNAVAYSVCTGKADTTLVVVVHLQTTGLSPEDRTRFKSMIKGDMDNAEAPRETRRLWALLGDASAKRAPQVNTVADFIERNSGKSIILAGDFNDSPISYAHYRLASQLTDCYVASANGPGISYYYNGFYVRIDNIMCSSNWKPYDCYVDNSIKASDHYPIVCHLAATDTK